MSTNHLPFLPLTWLLWGDIWKISFLCKGPSVRCQVQQRPQLGRVARVQPVHPGSLGAKEQTARQKEVKCEILALI